MENYYACKSRRNGEIWLALAVRPDPSLRSGVNAALIPHSVRPELVEGYRTAIDKELVKGELFTKYFFFKRYDFA